MEELNKNQLVLLVLLVSFVTSIGTGIMTVSLLMEAPVEVTNTINRVVERTIESVGPVQTIVTGGSKETQIQTVVVKEEDQVIGAIEKNAKSVVRIRERNSSVGVDNLYGLGVVVSKDGIIATDKKIISEAMQYVAVMSDGTEISLISVYADKKSDIGFFKAKPVGNYVFVPAVFASADPKLGQSTVVIGGNTTNAVSVGRVTLLSTKDIDPVAGTKYISSFTSDIAPVDTVYGGPVYSLSGELLGLSISAFSSSKTYIPAALVKKEAQLLEAPKNTPAN